MVGYDSDTMRGLMLSTQLRKSRRSKKLSQRMPISLEK